MKKKYVSLLLLALTLIVFAFSGNVSAQNILEDNLQISKRYNGQEGYGSSGIVDCKKYLKHKYKGSITKLLEKELDLVPIRQIDFSETWDEGNCVLVAITKMVNYYSINGDITIKDKNLVEIYRTVKNIAVSKYRYTPETGVAMIYIKPLIEDVFKAYNCKVSVHSTSVIWNFEDDIKNQIDNDRPVIFANSIGFGYYSEHALLVSGYETYNVNKKRLVRPDDKKYPMIQVHDGWSYSARYIDYNKFKWEIQNLTSTIITVSIGR